MSVFIVYFEQLIGCWDGRHYTQFHLALSIGRNLNVHKTFSRRLGGHTYGFDSCAWCVSVWNGKNFHCQFRLEVCNLEIRTNLRPQTTLTLSWKMLKNDQTYFSRFLKYVWPFFNIMRERVNSLSINPKKCSNTLKQFVSKLPTNCWVYLAILWGWRLKA